MKLLVQLLSEHAKVPVRATADAAGYDLVSAYDYVIPPNSRRKCETDITIGIPEGHYAQVGNTQ